MVYIGGTRIHFLTEMTWKNRGGLALAGRLAGRQGEACAQRRVAGGDYLALYLNGPGLYRLKGPLR